MLVKWLQLYVVYSHCTFLPDGLQVRIAKKGKLHFLSLLAFALEFLLYLPPLRSGKKK